MKSPAIRILIGLLISGTIVFWGINSRAGAQAAETKTIASQAEQKPPPTPEIRPGGELIPGGVKSFAQALKSAQEIAPGVKYYPLEGRNWQGEPLRGYMIEVDPTLPLMELRVATGKDILGKKETLSELAARHGAIAAVNGGFFDSSNGWPIGYLVQDEQLLVAWNMLRTSVGFTEQNKITSGYFSPQISIRVGDDGPNLKTDGINCSALENEITLYTPAWGNNVQIPSDGLGIVVAPDQDGHQIIDYITTGNAEIPAGGFVLTLRGEKTALGASLVAGTPVKLEINYDQQWKGLKHLVTAGPLLVEEGQPVLQGVAEGFRGNILGTVARTAIGVNKEGRVLLVVVDGKKQDWSVGLTLEELAYLMADLGAVRAAALDGGGSSGMWVKGKLVSRPSDGKERQIANAILVLRQLPVYMDDRRLFFDVPPVMEKGRVLVPMRRIFEAFQAGVNWDEETKTITATKDSNTIVLIAGKQEALINGNVYHLDVPASVVEGRVMVPLRFISKALGAEVTWQGKPPGVFIRSQDNYTREEKK
ncbi:MAG TPA: copper amine oxidase [Desulfotomaculum sp.]|nr:copper amine oxidase [Desulfotomaculum sp.]